MSKKKNDHNLVSRETEFINNRFMVKASIMDKAGSLSIMLAIYDVLEHNFKIQYFKTKDEAHTFIRLLQATNL